MNDYESENDVFSFCSASTGFEKNGSMLPGKFMGQGQKTDTAFSLAPQASHLQASEKLYESEKRMELIQTTGGAVQRFSTHLIKWSTEHRDVLFPCLNYCQITAPRDPDNRHYYPKFGYSLENTIMEKVLRHRQVGSYLSSTPNQNTIYYRSAGGLYWKVFINFAWPYQTTSNKQCHLQQGYERDVFVVLFNSSLFWWYYTTTFDTFNLKDYMIFGFRFNYPEDQTILQALRTQCLLLMNDFRSNAEHLKRGQTGSYTVYARKSKPIIDEIDRILAEHYGFTDEELDFIINYDIKYRMGQGNRGEGEE
jgi:hypothetical protein